MHDEIKKAVEVTQRAQRNYDLSKTIPQKDIDTLIHAASNGPSKQNETHFNLRVYTDPTIIKKIHEATKMYTMFSDDNVDEVFNDRDGKYNYKEEYFQEDFVDLIGDILVDIIDKEALNDND